MTNSYNGGTLLSYTPPAFVALQVNGQTYRPVDNTPASPPGAVFVPVPLTPQTSSPTVFGEDAKPIFINFPNDTLPNFMISPVQEPYFPVSAGITFDKLAEVDDEGKGTSISLTIAEVSLTCIYRGAIVQFKPRTMELHGLEWLLSQDLFN
jgi:hypothetical protein